MYKDVLLNLISTLYATVLSIIVVPFYLLEMGTDRYGLIGIYLIMLPVISILDLGFGVTALRESAKVRAGKLDSIYYIDLMRGMEIVFLSVFFVLSFIAINKSDYFTNNWLDTPALLYQEVKNGVAMMFICLLLRWLSTLYRGRVIGFSAITWFSIFTIIISTLRFGFSLVVVFCVSHRLEVFFGFQIVVGILELLGFIVKGRNLFSHRGVPVALRRSISAVRGSLALTSALSIGGLIWVLAAQFDKVLLMPRLALSEYAIYSLVVMLAGGISAFAAPVYNSLLPALIEKRAIGDMKGYGIQYRKYGQLTAALLLPVASLLALFPEQAIFVWTGAPGYGERWGQILSMYSVANVVLAFSIFGHYSLIAFGQMRLYILGIVIFSLALLCILPPLVALYNVWGAAVSWLAVNVAYLFIWVQFIHRRLLPTVGTAWLYFDIIPMGIIASMSALAAHFLLPITNSRTGIFLTLVACGLVSLISSVLTAPYLRSKAIELYKQKIN